MNILILISDRMANEDIKNLEEEFFQVNRGCDTPNSHLPKINDAYTFLIVRLKTKIRGELLENAKTLRIIDRAGATSDILKEDYPKRSKLLTLYHFIATPNAEVQTFRAQKRASIQIANNVNNALEKGDSELGYLWLK